MKFWKASYIGIAFLFAFSSCGYDPVPKPKGFNRIVLPKHTYQPLSGTYPYFFEYSSLAVILPDTSWLAEPYWVDIHYPYFNAWIQVTYKPISKDSSVQSYLDDSFRLTNKHTVKAYAIEESVVVLENGKVATVSELEGEVPTQYQFHITDSVNHFLRGALYFQMANANDSLAPAIQYIKEDVMHLLQTLEWKEK